MQCFSFASRFVSPSKLLSSAVEAKFILSFFFSWLSCKESTKRKKSIFCELKKGKSKENSWHLFFYYAKEISHFSKFLNGLALKHQHMEWVMWSIQCRSTARQPVKQNGALTRIGKIAVTWKDCRSKAFTKTSWINVFVLEVLEFTRDLLLFQILPPQRMQ